MKITHDCPLCGEDLSTTQHQQWILPSIKDQRQQTLLKFCMKHPRDSVKAKVALMDAPPNATSATSQQTKAQSSPAPERPKASGSGRTARKAAQPKG